MTKQTFLTLFLALALTAFAGCSGCGSDDDADEPVATATDPGSDDGGDDGVTPTGTDDNESTGNPFAEAQRAMQEAQEALNQNGGNVEAVDFRLLRDELPDELAGLPRTSAEGEKNRVMGIGTSQATGRYEEGDTRIELQLLDMGTVSGLAMFGYAWLMAEVDRENDRGFERTRTFSSGGEDYPSFEKFEGEGDRGSCEIQVWVAERFVVSVEGRNVEMEQCEEARDEISYRQLDRMKDEGTEEE